MKILPPTLRQKKRYIGLYFYSQQDLEIQSVKQILSRSLINTFGEIESAKINMWIINIKKVHNPKRFQYNIIVKCKRGYENKVRLAFNNISHQKDNRMVVHTLATSGTINKLNKKLDLL